MAGPRLTLYQRLYLHALSVCVLTLLISFAAVTWGRRGEWRQHFNRFANLAGHFAADTVAPHLHDPVALQQAVAEIGERFDAAVQLLDLQGQPLAGVGPALSAPTDADLANARAAGHFNPHRGEHWWLVALEANQRPIGYLQVAPAHPPDAQAALRLAATFSAILLLVALIIVPVTRSIARPLAALTGSARRFGHGDFEHRVPVGGPREVALLGQEMNDMARRLSALIHTQRQLLADVSHELRSPLARIAVALELARSQSPSSGGLEPASGAGRPGGPLDAIAADLQELGQLIHDLLTSSRLELRPELVMLRPVAAAELLLAARARALAAGMPEDQLALAGEAEAGGSEEEKPVPVAVWADAELVGHALGNLIDNARKHTPPGTAITLGSRRLGERLLIWVGDRGPGLPVDELPRLFEPFYRPDAARVRGQGGGAGIGLSLVRRIAELHGAPPFVESAPGAGATFGLSLELV